jgi:hypothetical protein
VLNSELVTTLDAFKLRDDKYTFLFESPNTNKDFLFLLIPKAFKIVNEIFSIWVDQNQNLQQLRLNLIL